MGWEGGQRLEKGCRETCLLPATSGSFCSFSSCLVSCCCGVGVRAGRCGVHCLSRVFCCSSSSSLSLSAQVCAGDTGGLQGAGLGGEEGREALAGDAGEGKGAWLGEGGGGTAGGEGGSGA